MFLPVDRSMMVSAPQRVAQTILSTSSAIEDVTAELPMFALTLTANALPMIIGSLSGWLWLAGITARPRATSSRTSSAGMSSRAAVNALSARVSPGPGRQPGRQVDHRVRVGVGPGGVVEVEVVSGGQVHPPEWHSQTSPGTGSLTSPAAWARYFAVGLAAARNGSGGHGWFDGNGHFCHLPTPALPGQVRTVDGPKPSSQRTRHALPRLVEFVGSLACEATPSPPDPARGLGYPCCPLDLLYRLAELLEQSVVVVARQEVSGSDDHGNRPVDEFERGQGGQTAVVGQLLRSRYLHLTEHRQVHGEGLAFADFLHGLGLGRCPTSFLFRHHLPFGNEGFAVSPGRAVNVGRMSTTGALADPISSLASVLSVPLLELYALLWRVGVVQIVETSETAATSHRSPRAQVAEGLKGPICPDPSAHGSERPRPRSRQRRFPAPAPTRAGRVACSRAVG